MSPVNMIITKTIISFICGIPSGDKIKEIS